MNIQNKFKKTNTIYKITKDIDLEGSTLIIPVGCTLDFQGGSFKNGTIEGNGTAIQSELRRIFDDNIVLEGMWNVKEAYPEWFGGKGDGVTDNTQAINNCIKYFTNTYISAGTYITNQIDDIPSFRTINGCGKKSIIQANPKMDLTNSYLLRTKNGGSGITFSNFVLLGGANSTESNYKIGGIYLRSTSNDVNDQWDTRNIIQNVEIKYCYAASIYVGTYQRENKISNCFITHTTNVGINCMGTDNMIIGCTVASSHHEGIIINGNNRVDSCKCFGCGASSTVTGKYALSLIGSKCNVSNVELQQNNYGGCIIQGNSNYVQITCDNNGSGTTNTVLGCHVVGSYNTVSVTSYNFSFHDDQYERYFVSTNWNTVGNNITVNGTPLQKNKMSALSPWSVDNICNNIMWNGYNITQSREVPFDKLVLPDLFRSNGTGSFYVNDSGLSFKLTSVTAVNVDALVQAISIHNSNAIDPDGCFSVKARFHKDGDIDTSVYPIIRVITRYKDSSGTTLTRVDQNTTVNLLDNKDSLDVYALTQYHYLSDKPISILSVSVEFAIRSTKLLSDVSINAYFDDIKIGATTSGNKVKFVNTNIDGTLASKVIIANKLSDFTQENTIYKITTDLNLNTALLELPANCTLDFQGGSFSNGTIVGNNTKVIPTQNYVFKNVEVSNISTPLYASNFGLSPNNVDNSEFLKLALSGNRKVIQLGVETYIITKPIEITTSNTTLVGKANQQGYQSSITVSLSDVTEETAAITLNCFNVKISNISFWTNQNTNLLVTPLRLTDELDQSNLDSCIEDCIFNYGRYGVIAQGRGLKCSNNTFHAQYNPIKLQLKYTKDSVDQEPPEDGRAFIITNNRFHQIAASASVGISTGYAVYLENLNNIEDCTFRGLQFSNNYIDGNGSFIYSSASVYGLMVNDNICTNLAARTEYYNGKITRDVIYNGNIIEKKDTTLRDPNFITIYVNTLDGVSGINISNNVFKRIATTSLVSIQTGDESSTTFKVSEVLINSNIIKTITDSFYILQTKKLIFENIHVRNNITDVYCISFSFSTNSLGNDMFLNCKNIDADKFDLDSITPLANRESHLSTGKILISGINTNSIIDGNVGDINSDIINKTLSFFDGTNWRYYDGAKRGSKRFGNTSNRPDVADVFPGFAYYNATNRELEVATTTGWVDTNGYTSDIKVVGPTDQRPTGIKGGFVYIDTTLNKPIYWTGTTWIDSTGTTV